MLTQLSIRHILLLKQCDIAFGPGLNVLTGETGAGKSILLDALGLVLGERGDASLVRHGETQASVTAEFAAVDASVKAVLGELELPQSDELVIRRTLTADGKSRAFVNDEPVSAAALKRLGELLVARHGQHDQRGLLDPRTHRTVLDAVAGNQSLLVKTAAAFRQWKDALARVEELARLREAALREESWLRQTVDELGKLAPEEGEEETLVELRRKAQQAQQGLATLKSAHDALLGGDSVAMRLRQAAKALAKTEGEAIAPISAALERAETEIEEASVAIERLLDAAEINPAELERAEDRLHALRAAARKFNLPVASLAGHLAEARVKLHSIVRGEQDANDAAAAVEKTRAAYVALAEQLYAAREKAGATLVKAVEKELKPLKMGSTKLRVVQTLWPENQWGEAGNAQVQFEVATNAGMPFGPLNKVASGGELSRLLLAMKVVLHGDVALTSIFDEIDAGTGGAVAEAIGLRLKQLAASGQVLVVTHLPQVAALASHHLFITKEGTKDIRTNVRVLAQEERAEELARMLSGATISDEARKAAAQLLQAAS